MWPRVWLMRSVKAAISLPRSLLERANELARELGMSRSRLFALAVEQFVERYGNRKPLAATNDAYDGVADPEEQRVRARMRRQHRHMVEGQW